MSAPQHPHPDCAVCNEYMESRANVLPLFIVDAAKRRGINAAGLVVRYVEGVHRRHLAGLSLDTG